MKLINNYNFYSIPLYLNEKFLNIINNNINIDNNNNQISFFNYKIDNYNIKNKEIQDTNPLNYLISYNSDEDNEENNNNIEEIIDEEKELINKKIKLTTNNNNNINNFLSLLENENKFSYIQIKTLEILDSADYSLFTWKSSIYLSIYLFSQFQYILPNNDAKNKIIIELGAGTSLPSITLASLLKKRNELINNNNNIFFFLTERSEENEMLEFINEIIHLNQLSSYCFAKGLTWPNYQSFLNNSSNTTTNNKKENINPINTMINFTQLLSSMNKNYPSYLINWIKEETKNIKNKNQDDNNNDNVNIDQVIILAADCLYESDSFPFVFVLSQLLKNKNDYAILAIENRGEETNFYNFCKLFQLDVKLIDFSNIPEGYEEILLVQVFKK